MADFELCREMHPKINKILYDKQLNSLFSNPMLLYLAIEVAEGKGDTEDLLPSTRSEMYEAFISDLFDHYENRKGKTLCANRVQIENALTDFYFELQRKNKVSCKEKEALEIFKKHAEDTNFRKTTSQDILEDSFKLGLLARNKSEVIYGIHQSFQEYFAATKLKELFEKGFNVSETFNHPKWRDVVIFTSEMLEPVDEFIDSIISKGEIFLASNCVSKASNEKKERLCALLVDKTNSKYELEKKYSIESLGRIKTCGFNIVAEILKDKSKGKDIRKVAAVTLGDIKAQEATEPLINVLNDKEEDKDMRKAAVSALGRIKEQGKMEVQEAIESLISVLKDKEEDIDLRMTVMVYSGLRNVHEVIEPLISVSKDKEEDKDMRDAAIQAFGWMKAQEAIEMLINVLNDKEEDKSLRIRTARTLGIISVQEVIEPLISVLKDKSEDKDVREAAAYALGITKRQEAIEPLIIVLKDKEEAKDMREQAASSLAAINAIELVKPLINVLKDNSEDIIARIGAANILINVKTRETVEPVVSILKNKDENMYVRWIAVSVLGYLQAQESIEPLILTLIDKEEYEEIRRSAAQALGETKSEKAVQSLIDALTDKSIDVRKNAAQALGEICTIRNKKQLEALQKSNHEFLANTSFEILNEIEKKERSKIVLFEAGEKSLKI